MKISCPHCEQSTFIRSSRKQTPAFYEAYVVCKNQHCGWSGKVQIEIAKTTTPSLKPNPTISIPLDATIRVELLAQLAAG